MISATFNPYSRDRRHPAYAVLLILIILLITACPAYGGTVKTKETSVYKGDTKVLSAAGIGPGAKWKSSNSKIVKVTESGKITGKKVGTATVTVSGNGRSIKYKVKVKTYHVRIAVVDVDGSSEPWKIWNAFPDSDGCSIHVVNSIKELNEKRYDGLILPGGGDVNPKRYKKKNSASYNINNASDSLQIKAFKQFRKDGKPILGICKGAQLINVCMGGTLKQDIGHSHYYGVWRRIKVSSASVFKNFAPSSSVVHWHHQAVGKIGKGLRATMWDSADKKIIEAVEGITEPIYGLQWHPDMMGALGDTVFSRFSKICRKEALKRR